MIKLLKPLLVVLIFSLLSSCASKENVLLMQNLKNGTTNQIIEKYSSKLQGGDILTITVSSTDNIGTAPFNVIVNDSSLGNDISTSRQRLVNYVVDEDGTIQFPVLGSLKIGGKTTLEARKFIEEKLKKYLKEPIVNVEWLNFNYTVIGSVNRPGQFKSVNQRTSILDALGNAGDLDIYASRKDVTVIREVEGQQTFYKLDLTKTDFMNSEAYYVKQNDVIMVNPNGAQIQSSAYNRNTPIFVSVASLMISVIVLLTR